MILFEHDYDNNKCVCVRMPVFNMLYKRRDGEMARHAPGPHIYIMAFFRTSNDLIKYYMFSFGNSATSAKNNGSDMNIMNCSFVSMLLFKFVRASVQMKLIRISVS